MILDDFNPCFNFGIVVFLLIDMTSCVYLTVLEKFINCYFRFDFFHILIVTCFISNLNFNSTNL